MLQKKITIVNKLGLHARASVKLINLAGRFQSEIVISYDDRQVNAKSILGIMGLGAAQGAEVELMVSGPDEEPALQQICELINNRFGEEQ